MTSHLKLEADHVLYYLDNQVIVSDVEDMMRGLHADLSAFTSLPVRASAKWEKRELVIVSDPKRGLVLAEASQDIPARFIESSHYIWIRADWISIYEHLRDYSMRFANSIPRTFMSKQTLRREMERKRYHDRYNDGFSGLRFDHEFESLLKYAEVNERLVCRICYLPFFEDDKGRIHIDHRTSIKDGGHNMGDNLQCAHEFCNRMKGARAPYEFKDDGYANFNLKKAEAAIAPIKSKFERNVFQSKRAGVERHIQTAMI